MTGFGDVIAGLVPFGVYVWPSAGPTSAPGEIARTCEVAEWNFGHIDGQLVTDKAASLAAIAHALDFPAYFGGNLDALWDCLQDIATPCLLLWDHWDVASEHDPTGFISIIGVLGDRASDGGLVVLLRGEGPDFGIPTLSA